MQTHTQFRTATIVGFALAFAVCAAIGMALFKNAAPLQVDMAMAAPTAVNTILNDIDLEIYLRIDSVTGEADDDRHRNDVLVDSFSFGTKRTPNATTPTMTEFLVTMPANKASAKLMVYTAGSVSVPKAVLAVRRKGGNVDFLRWTLTDAFVSSYQTVGNLHGDGVQDQVGFTFGKIESEYRQVLPDGTYGAPVKSGWDRRSNKPVPVK